jgi:hypothetical protein
LRHSIAPKPHCIVLNIENDVIEIIENGSLLSNRLVYGQKLMNKIRPFYLAMPALMLLATTNAVAVSTNRDLALLDTLERGMWQLRPTGTSGPVTKICVANPESLTQIQHSGIACEQYIVRSSANSVTVSYTCKGQGQGLTTIRKESKRIIHIQSQGIRNNAPFSISVEGRKIGAC